MTEYPYISATEARKNFSEVINNTIYVKPQIIKRNKNDVLMMHQNQMLAILDAMKLDVDVHREDDAYVITNEIMEGAMGWGKTKEEAIDDFCNFLDVLAHQFYKDYERMIKTEQGKRELPFVFKIMCANSFQDIKDMLICHDGKN